MRQPRISVTPNPAMLDEPADIRISGAPADAWITVRAAVRDNWGTDWESFGEFWVDSRGECRVAEQIPREGTYRCADPMGLIWSMVRKETDPAHRTPFAPLQTKLNVLVKGETVAETVWTRRMIAPHVVRTPVRENGLVGTFFVPDSGGPYPAIVVLGGSEGGLREHNAALALAYFKAGALPQQLMHLPLEYIQSGIRWLQAQPNVAAAELGIVGTSRGGELALLCASLFPEIRAVVGLVPSHVVNGALGPTPSGERPFAWTWKGARIPYMDSPAPLEVRQELKRQREAGEPLQYRPYFLSQLMNEARVDEVKIPVHDIQGPVLLVSGGDDRMWPSSIYCERIIEQLARHNHPYERMHLLYPEAGHMIYAPYGPMSDRGSEYVMGGTPEADAKAQADAWPEIVAFLTRSLGGSTLAR